MLGQSCQPLVVTGHSLGGAMAHLYAAIACELVDLAPAAVVTFGAPAAFWGDDSRAAITCPLRRYVMPGDPAPWLPPLFTQPGKPLLLPVPADAPRLPWRRWWWAHDPATYLAGLEASEHRIIPAAEAALKEG